MKKFVAAMVLFAFPVVASGQSNDIIGKQSTMTRKIFIHSSIPSGCQYTFTNAATTWNGANTKARLVWTNYISTRAYSYNASTGKNVSTSSNTVDTQVEAGKLDDFNNLGQTSYRGSGTNLTDGDVIINIDKLSTVLACPVNPASLTSTQVDLEYSMLHELGHVWGLGHDTVNTDAVVAPPKYWGPASAKRTLTTSDSGRLRTQYGVQ